METYTPANSINKKEFKKHTNEDVRILRESNYNYKLEIIELKQKLKEIYSVLTDNTDNLIQQ